MERSTIPSRPLCVDMDGTLLEIDTMEDLIASYLCAHFWQGWRLLWWLARGRAYFKKRLGEEAELPVDSLPAHLEFLRYLEEQYAAGRTLVLVSAADEKVVQLVANRFKIFSSVLGSDGKTNLRGEAKLKRLTEIYGKKGFDYAGNSSVDVPVWRGSAESIVVNADPIVETRAWEVSIVAHVFSRRTSRSELLKQLIRRHQRSKTT